MAHVIDFATFERYRRQRLKHNATRTPHQMARETLMRSEGFKNASMASNGYSMMTKPTPTGEGDVSLYAIHKDGSVHYMGTWPEDSIHVK